MGNAGDLNIPNLFSTLNLNTTSNFKTMQKGWHDQTQSIFANVELGWKSMLYLTVTGRNEWASQLAYRKQLVVLLSFGGSLGRDLEHGRDAEVVLVPEGPRLVHAGGLGVQPLPHATRAPSTTSSRTAGRLPRPTPTFDLKPEDTEVVGGRSERQVLEPPLDRCYLLPFEHLQSDLQDRPVGRFGLHQSIHPDR